MSKPDSLTHYLSLGDSPAAIAASRKMVMTLANLLTMSFEDYISRRAKNASVADRALAAARITQILMIAESAFVSTTEDLVNSDMDAADSVNDISSAVAGLLKKKFEQWYVEATPAQEVVENPFELKPIEEEERPNPPGKKEPDKPLN